MNDYNFLYDNFPEIISGEQLRKILHISKRKCAYLLKSGVIPCIDTGQKSRCYYIQLDDVIEYIKNAEDAFEAMKPQIPPEGLRERLSDEWHDLPELLTITDVAKITGYTANAVDRWIVKGSLRSVTAQMGLVTCREWLIDFCCKDGYNIAKKVDRHIELLGKLLYC